MTALGEKIRQAIAIAPVETVIGQAPIAVSLSVNVAAFQAETDTAELLMARADAALYRAKQGGRNRVELDVSTPETSYIGALTPVSCGDVITRPAPLGAVTR